MSMKRTLTAPGRSVRLSWGTAAAVAALVGGTLMSAGSAQAAGDSETFAPTGAEQTYVVPSGVTSVTVTVAGAPGSAGELGSGGGQGRVVTADLSVTPGQNLYVEVGGPGAGSMGGFNGGGAGGGHGAFAGFLGGGGGGASDIRTCPVAGPCSTGTSLDSRLIVAGGGGGGGVNAGGAADTAGSSSTYFPDAGGKAGTLTTGGAGGSPANEGAAGFPGAYGVGGAGADGVGGGTPGGGGGGGGYYGGGGAGSGGAGGGGGGGSSFVTSSATNVSLDYDSTRQPSVIITADSAPVIDTQPADVAVTSGDTATFTAAASGFPTPTVQWQTSTGGGAWGDIDGETDTTLTVASTTAAMDGNRYRAVFTNAFGGSDHTATSESATLTVNTPSALHTVTFDSAGGSAVRAQHVQAGDPVTSPADPARTGYAFTGWYTDSDATIGYDFSTPVTGNLTLYAGWSPNSSSGPGSGPGDESGEASLPDTGSPIGLIVGLAALLTSAAGLGLLLSGRRTKGKLA
jgi:uncharacterized repeat protein (TIGR02543 family)